MAWQKEKNRTLEEFIRSLLSESKLQKGFWAEALATSTYIINRSPTKAVVGMTPYEALTGGKTRCKTSASIWMYMLCTYPQR